MSRRLKIQLALLFAAVALVSFTGGIFFASQMIGNFLPEVGR